MANLNNFDPVAWSIDGGLHPGQLLRTVAFAALGGREGIVNYPDLRVHQLATPGAGVEIDPGAAVMRSGSPGVSGQSYAVNNRQVSRLDIAPTGGAARADLIIVRVKDPQYSPWLGIVGAANPATFQYVEPFVIQNVPAALTSVWPLGLGYTAYAMARINIPANTSVITNAMITDLRSTVSPAHDPKEARSLRVFTPNNVAVKAVATNLAKQQFPTLNELIACPSWATRATIILMANGILCHGVRCYSGLRAEYGYSTSAAGVILATEYTGIHHEDDTPAEDDSRQTVIAGGSFYIPPAFRGQSHYLRAAVQFDAAGTNDSWMQQDSASTVIADVEFEELPD